MDYINRKITSSLRIAIQRGKSILLLGPRQTGKTTLLTHIKTDKVISLLDPSVRIAYEKNPAQFIGEIEALAETTSSIPLIVVDEIQKVPVLMDSIQLLIDKKMAQFILTGSSARKLRRGEEVNLLPGRVLQMRLDPFVIDEMPPKKQKLEELLLYGSLPEILLENDNTCKETDLTSYVMTYLEEEVRAEALTRNLGAFSRFLELAAAESGRIVNFAKLSCEVGVAHTTIASYYQILEDCLIAERIEPISRSATRRKLTKSHKYLFFDLGLRRLAAQEGVRLPNEYMGHLFEQFIGLELIRNARQQLFRTSIRFWRDPDGPEVDWILETDHTLIPIEVKWTTTPTRSDTQHLQTFLREYNKGQKGYIICRVDSPIKLAENIYALPWKDISALFKGGS